MSTHWNRFATAGMSCEAVSSSHTAPNGLLISRAYRCQTVFSVVVDRRMEPSQGAHAR